MRRHVLVLLCSITVVAAVLRFYKLGEIPPSLTWDETAWGYNAYALGIDGRDEFGRFFPLDYLESFGDYKPPVYAYLTILPVKIFGLNEFAVRFPSAFFGTLSVILVYFLSYEMFYFSKKKYRKGIAFITTTLFAFSPWHINLSRAAFEANVASFFLILGMYLFLRALRKESFLLFFSMLSFVLSLYTFNTARIVAPLLLFFATIFFYKKLWLIKKVVVVSIIFGILFSIPFIHFIVTPQAKLRYYEVNIFSDLKLVVQSNTFMENDRKFFHTNTIPFWSKLIHNRRIIYATAFMKHYFDHFNPNFLFIRGDGNPKFSTQDVGELYLWSLPFLILGILYMIHRKIGYWNIVIAWLLIGIFPAAVARETPHALRIESTLPTWQIMTAVGVVCVFYLTKKRFRKHAKLFWILTIVCIFFYFVNVVYYLHGYYAHYSFERSYDWQYGYKEAILYAESVKDRYEGIVFTSKLGRPYSYMLFFSKMNPDNFRKLSKVQREVMGFVHVVAVPPYYFPEEDKIGEIQSFLKNKHVLYISLYQDKPENVLVKKVFYLKNDIPILVAYEKS